MTDEEWDVWRGGLARGGKTDWLRMQIACALDNGNTVGIVGPDGTLATLSPNGDIRITPAPSLGVAT